MLRVYLCAGRGKIIWPNGRVYDGSFDEDHIHGPGVFFAESGLVLKNKTWDKGEAARTPGADPTKKISV